MLKDQFADLVSRVWAIFGFLFDTALIWAPIVLAITFGNLWMRYVRMKYVSQIEWIMLEVKVPKNITRTPLAMEVVLNILYQSAAGTWLERITKGKVKDWFSLEIVSLGGDVHFFMRVPKSYKNIVEAKIYSQYPNVEVHEVPDYTRYVKYPGGEWDLWGVEMELSEPDPYPIATYVDYGLDKEGLKEEEKVDPIVPMVEFMGSMRKDEQVWVQILVQATNKRYKVGGGLFSKRDDWRKEGQDIITKLMKRDKKKPQEGAYVDFSEFSMTKGERALVEAIERNISKFGFDCGIRALYLAKQGTFDVANIKGLLNTFKQYSGFNSFDAPLSKMTFFQYPWQDFKNMRVNYRKRRIFTAYKRRGYFVHPFKKKPFVLNTEELATVFHFPGGVAETPTFGRIDSKKAEPPSNLPA